MTRLYLLRETKMTIVEYWSFVAQWEEPKKQGLYPHQIRYDLVRQSWIVDKAGFPRRQVGMLFEVVIDGGEISAASLHIIPDGGAELLNRNIV